MRWWVELGVDRGADFKVIRSAYARLIKRFQPETHPKRFQQLRTAYEQARAAREGRTLKAGELIAASGPALAVRKLFHRPMPHIGEEAIELLAQVAWLFRNPSRPYKAIDRWREIFDDPRLWNIECREQFSDGLFSILIGQLRCDNPRVNRICMSRDTWKMIDRELGWARSEASLFVRFGAGNAEFVMRNIRHALGHAYYSATDADGGTGPDLVWDWAVARGVPIVVWVVAAASLVAVIRIAVN